MPNLVRPLSLAISLAFASAVFAATPEKPAAKAAPAATPNSVSVLEFGHNLSSAGVERVQAVLDRFNKETGGTMKLVRLEKDQKPADLNLVSRYDMSDVITHPKILCAAARSHGQGPATAECGRFLGRPEGRRRRRQGPAGGPDGSLFDAAPVLQQGGEAFRKARLNPEQLPKTWFEMQGMLDKLQEAGYSCPYTTSWPVWVHIDNVSAVSGVPAVADNGRLAFTACRRSSMSR